jgi:hypothetical protein
MLRLSTFTIVVGGLRVAAAKVAVAAVAVAVRAAVKVVVKVVVKVAVVRAAVKVNDFVPMVSLIAFV